MTATLPRNAPEAIDTFDPFTADDDAVADYCAWRDSQPEDFDAPDRVAHDNREEARLLREIEAMERVGNNYEHPEA